MRELDKCIVCGQSEFKLLYSSTFDGNWKDAIPFFLTNRQKAVHGDIVKCINCGFVFTNPQFEPEEYHQIYRNIPQFNGEWKDSKKRFKLLKNKVLNYCSTGKLVDLGCHDDLFIVTMGECFDGTGIEIGENGYSERSFRGKILCGDFLEMVKINKNLWKNKFDVLTAWDVLEHISELEEYLKTINFILKKDGFMFCTLPNIASFIAKISRSKWNCILLEHLWYFNPETFSMFVRRFGFKVLEATNISYIVDVGTILKRIEQTYMFRIPPIIPERLKKWNFPLRIGVMLTVSKKIETC